MGQRLPGRAAALPGWPGAGRRCPSQRPPGRGRRGSARAALNLEYEARGDPGFCRQEARICLMLRIVLTALACVILLGLVLGAGLRLLGREPLAPSQRIDLSQSLPPTGLVHSARVLPGGDMLVVEGCDVWMAHGDCRPYMMISSGDILPQIALAPLGEIALVRGGLDLGGAASGRPGSIELFSSSGTLLSSQPLNGPVFSDNLAASGDYFVFGQGQLLRCFDFQGNERWTWQTQGTALIAPQPAPDGGFYCADNAGGLSCVSAAGEELWQADCPGALWSPQRCDDWIALRSRDRLLGFDLQGNQLFSQPLEAQGELSLLLPLPQGLQCCDEQRIFVLSRSGRRRELSRLGPGFGAQAILDSAGRLYVAHCSDQTRMEKFGDDLQVYGGKNRTHPGEGLELFAFDRKLKALGRFQADEHGGQLIRIPDGRVAIGIHDALLVFGD